MDLPEDEVELTEPQVSDVPEPDQEPVDPDEDPDENPDLEPEPEPEPEPEAQGPTQEEWEERFKKAEKSFKTYTAAVTRYWEEDAVHLMPFSFDPGAPPGFVDMRNKGRVDDETKAVALAFLGFDAESDMADDPYSTPCATCNGWGLVKTGSRVPNQDVRPCKDCRGVGYIADDAQPSTSNGVITFESHEPGLAMVPAATGPESPEVEALRNLGYTIIPPMRTEP